MFMNEKKITVTLEYCKGSKEDFWTKPSSVCYIRFKKLKKGEFNKTEERSDAICDYSKKTGELTGIEFYNGMPLKVKKGR
jgi:hypothetical protein